MQRIEVEIVTQLSQFIPQSDAKLVEIETIENRNNLILSLEMKMN